MAFSNSTRLSLSLLALLPLLTNADTIAEFLNPQNAVRQQLGLPPLRWNGDLARYAKWYANQRRRDCALVHSTANYGENLFWGRGTGWKIGDAVAAWAAERQSYDYSRNVCVGKSECLHYTQLVWRATRRVGCARIKCGSGDTYVVCEYDPHGKLAM